MNTTMREALSINELSREIFPTAEEHLAQRAFDGARRSRKFRPQGSYATPGSSRAASIPSSAGFLDSGPVWMRTVRNEPRASIPGPVGALYSQPQDTCRCGSRIFEFYTCRNCGAAYARAYTDDVEYPSFLWAEAGSSFRSAAGRIEQLQPLDLLLESPSTDDVELAGPGPNHRSPQFGEPW